VTEPLDDEADEYASSDENPSAWLDRDRQLVRLRRALLLLREDKRELVVLARYRAMSHEQIAALLDIAPATVKVRLFRAVQELKDIFHQLERGTWTKDTRTTARTV
jgi:RNA polymerase sigma factor (sigma-70 family)